MKAKGRTLLVVLDSVGCGFAPDAGRYGDEGAATLQHILERCPGVALPTLRRLGLDAVLRGAAGGGDVAWDQDGVSAGVLTSATAGKDTTSGHWEIAGCILEEGFPVFARVPDELRLAIEREAGVEFLGGEAASGTEIIERHGEEHLRTGRPILYTSADSVLQIAAHEEVWSAERLDALCRVARRHADGWRIGRVISRPFRGQPGAFVRTAGRHDYSIEPPMTLLERLAGAGVPVTGVGKIGDIFAGRGIARSIPTKSNADGMRRIGELWEGYEPGLVFANLVDFDTLYGHRRDVGGYARALEEFDAWLGGFLREVGPGDWVMITADHGNDPTWHGTDHTRERVPLWWVHPGRRGRWLGVRSTYADIAATLAWRFGVAWEGPGDVLMGNEQGR